ncbi:hypothetical protein ASG25_21745 [Rhizobium sp. Leaf384]|nr:hypothetical protein ASG25_21745 [Rhizobium sp. Leaf384]KQS82298.1 hypothetical protein ASG58_22480 [Rhizobium sp. Leaf383]
MEMKTTTVAMALMGLLLASGTAAAKNDAKLPATATAITSEEVTALFSGNTTDWKPARAFWAADGKVIGLYPKKGSEAVGEGKWTVTGNKMCYEIDWRTAKKTAAPFHENACNEFYKAGKKIWTKNVENSDAQYKGNIYTGEDKKLLKGDKASKEADAVKAKFEQ